MQSCVVLEKGVGEIVEKLQGLSGKSSPREVPRPLRLFPRVRSAASQGMFQRQMAMAIMAIWPFLAVMAHMAMADSKTNMAIMGIQ